MESEVLVGVISTHAHLTALCRQIGRMQGLKIMVYEGALDSSLPGLKYFEKKGVEVLITTRGNTMFIRDHTNIPVVSVPENKFDIFYPIARATKQYGKKFKLVVYKESPIKLTEISEILDFAPEILVFNNSAHLENLLERLQRSGQSDYVIIGGGFVCQTASALGFMTEAVNISDESLNSAFEAAKGLAMARRTERKETRRLKAILDCSYEGIIAVNEKGKITLFNQAAENLFKLKADEVVGQTSVEVLKGLKLEDSLTIREAVIGEIIEVNNTKLILNRVPIINDEKISGGVVSFQAINTIQNMEEKIRKELIAKSQSARYRFNDIRGNSQSIRSVVELAKRYADCDETVLILGESGSGKELFAQSMHGISNRKNKTFIAVNCAAIPGSLLESELFGYSEGSFTGARKGGKPGLFELAHGGTMFLDEIGEMPLEVQAKLLRVIQEKEVRRIGGDRVIRIDVRIFAATHRDLGELVREGKFRNDLFYRLDVLHLKVPSLWERRDDIPCLAMEILKKHTEISLRQKKVIVTAVTSRPDYVWPGNVRELENIIRRLVVLTKGLNEREALEQGKKMFDLHCGNKTIPFVKNKTSEPISINLEGDLKSIVADVEKQVIRYTLNICGGDHSEAARRLNIGRTTLWRKLNEDYLPYNKKTGANKKVNSTIKEFKSNIRISSL